ncbi:hypothetical protein WL29_22255 [Burkholderia ubonensis]|uniref:Uncharacterized protein n=1 Tax=Burkholderia ubonensis TaxID=101571 RepID=A0A119HFL4_9BURK|nr:DUF29 family protein [Burkholderia ubonensis]KWA84091.1 hypothetical protein WL29_22255 [Burkholderia ubonensis]
MDNDFLQWLTQQQKLFAERRFDEMDLPRVEDEVFNAASEQVRDPVLASMKDIIKFFILFDYFPGYGEHIAASEAIQSGRAAIGWAFTHSPSLQATLSEEFPGLWVAVRDDMRELFEHYDHSPELVPTDNPYTLDQLLDEKVYPKHWD